MELISAAGFFPKYILQKAEFGDPIHALGQDTQP